MPVRLHQKLKNARGALNARIRRHRLQVVQLLHPLHRPLLLLLQPLRLVLEAIVEHEPGLRMIVRREWGEGTGISWVANTKSEFDMIMILNTRDIRRIRMHKLAQNTRDMATAKNRRQRSST